MATPAELSDVSPAELAQALALRSARYGARQTRRAMRRLPAAARELRARGPKGPFARAAEHGYSIWSNDARFSLASVKSQGSAYSVWSLLSAGSAASAFSIGSVLSIGSAGSILSIGSAGSILSIGSAGSVCAIGAVGRRRPTGGPVDDDAVDHRAPAAPGLSVIEQGGNLLGLLAVGTALWQPSR